MAKRTQAKKKKHPLETKTKRTTVGWQLNWLDRAERKFAELVQDLKDSRIWKETAMLGVRLVVALRNNDTALLLNEFPDIADVLVAKERKELELARAALAAERAEFERQKAKGNEILDKITRIEDLLNQDARPMGFGNARSNKAVGESVSANGGLRPVSGGNAKTINAPQFSAPTFDDDDSIELEVRKDTSAGGRATANFLASLQGLVDTYETAPIEPNGNARQISAPSFDAPVFDDDEGEDLF